MTNRIPSSVGQFSPLTPGNGVVARERKNAPVQHQPRRFEKPFDIEPDAIYGNAIFSAPRSLPASAMELLQQHAALHWGDTVAVLPKKPDSDFTGNAIWLSSNDKDYGVCVNGKKSRVADLQLAGKMFAAAATTAAADIAAADSGSTSDVASALDVDVDFDVGADVETAGSKQTTRQEFIDEVKARWGDALSCVDASPKDTPAQPVIWESKTPGSFGLQLTDGKKYRARNLDHAAKILSSRGVMTTDQQRSLDFTADVHSIWGDEVEARKEAPLGNHSAAAIWPSGSKPGDFILYVPGHRARRVHSLEQATDKFRALGVLPREESEAAAAQARFTQEVRERCGPEVLVLAQRPGPEFKGVAVWKSSRREGQLGLLLPDGRTVRAANLDRVATKLAPFGIAARMGRGDNITVKGPGLSEVERLALEQEHGIQIKPIQIDGKTIALLFASGNEPSESVFLSCHGSGRAEDVKFNKPSGLNIFHAVQDNFILKSKTTRFAQQLMNGEDIDFSEPSQIYDSKKNLMTNYRLRGTIGTRPEQMAALVGEMRRNPEGKSFDVMLLNRDASGIRFGDVLQALKDEAGSNFPKEIICHFCRTKDDSAMRVHL